MTKPNDYIPMIAKRNYIIISSNPSDIKAGSAATIVSKIICSFYARLMILSTRSTLKILTMVAYVARSESVLR